MNDTECGAMMNDQTKSLDSAIKNHDETRPL
jgi:hypothetical protein